MKKKLVEHIDVICANTVEAIRAELASVPDGAVFSEVDVHEVQSYQGDSMARSVHLRFERTVQE